MGADAAVQSLADGSARAYVIVNRASAPTQFRFNFNLPAGARFVSTPTPYGEAISLIGSTGSGLGTIMPAWARAADGSMVPTSYTIDGSSIIQTVLHNGARYPVVADPWITFGCCTWQPPGFYIVIHLTWNDRIAVLYGGWGAAVVLADVICGRVGKWLSALCGVGLGYLTSDLFNAVNQSLYNGYYCGIALQYVASGEIGRWYEC